MLFVLFIAFFFYNKRIVIGVCEVWLRGMILASHAKGPGFDPDLCRVDFMSSLSTDRPWCQYNGLGMESG